MWDFTFKHAYCYRVSIARKVPFMIERTISLYLLFLSISYFAKLKYIQMVTFKYRNIIMSSPIIITISTITLVVLLMINSCTFYLPSYIFIYFYIRCVNLMVK